MVQNMDEKDGRFAKVVEPFGLFAKDVQYANRVVNRVHSSDGPSIFADFNHAF